MSLRAAAAIAVVLAALGVVGLGTTAAAAPNSPPVPPTIVEGRPETECISANPRPDCSSSEEFDRSSGRHLVLFGLLAVAMVAIAVVVVRSTVRNDRAGRRPAG